MAIEPLPPPTWRHSRIQSYRGPFGFIYKLFRPTKSPQFLPDTAAASFYRIYEFFVINDTISLRNELEYFCCRHPEWAVSDLPDPIAGSGPKSDFHARVRYAVLAVLTTEMCDAFNYRIDLGLPRDAPPIIQGEEWDELKARPKVHEQPPEWAKRRLEQPPLARKVVFRDPQGQVLEDDSKYVSKKFKKMNIIVEGPHIYFI
ncbi:hypothetical protein EST38_g13945 [Candolleomyces aberdarensis]|uniref:Uncharacterized protein n=1 Tax=Candolleomyces aberdarensis TaxID=2316362 RepID=A0A4Q2D0Z6_9AGAR|nr:hypothetical protein EST38_g13945 [Candolleomyces aberdarensis]